MIYSSKHNIIHSIKGLKPIYFTGLLSVIVEITSHNKKKLFRILHFKLINSKKVLTEFLADQKAYVNFAGICSRDIWFPKYVAGQLYFWGVHDLRSQ